MEFLVVPVEVLDVVPERLGLEHQRSGLGPGGKRGESERKDGQDTPAVCAAERAGNKERNTSPVPRGPPNRSILVPVQMQARQTPPPSEAPGRMKLALVCLLLTLSAGHSVAAEGTARWKAYFSPHGGCTEAIVGEITHAKSNLLVQAYSFTSAPIAKAVVEAHRRGVHVAVVLDSSQASQRYSSADFLANSGVPVRIDAKHGIAHNKVIIIDGTTVLTGSFNFSKAAESSNAENLLVLTDPALARTYTTNFNAHAAHSTNYIGRGVSVRRS
jgi:phosphatidylserine/phosphatidylglycerophosphate/cardiolipin synthase-like enzyme